MFLLNRGNQELNLFEINMSDQSLIKLYPRAQSDVWSIQLDLRHALCKYLILMLVTQNLGWSQNLDGSFKS